MSLLLLFRGQPAPTTYTKTGTVAAGTKTAAADVFEATETGTVAAGAKLAGVEQAGFVAKTGTVAADTTLAGADVFTATETGTVAAGTKLAGPSQTGAVSKTGTVAAATWASAADVYTATETGTVKAGTRLAGFTRGVPGPTGKFVLTNARVVINGTDVSTYCNAVAVELDTEEIDITPLGSPYRDHMQGQTTGKFTVDLYADQSVITPAFWSSLDSPVTVSVTPRNLATDATNPTWTGSAVAVRKTELTGSAGEAAKASVELHSTGAVLVVES